MKKVMNAMLVLAGMVLAALLLGFGLYCYPYN
jgi:hypothetical protein